QHKHSFPTMNKALQFCLETYDYRTLENLVIQSKESQSDKYNSGYFTIAE
ncbi:unnamed protein product, partial [marine sediment metagenome]